MSSVNEGYSPHGAPTVSRLVKFMYSFGEIANSIKASTFALFSLFFATIVLGLPGTVVGIIGFIAVLWDAAIDPLIGYVTDKMPDHSRRYTFMLIGALTLGAGYWAFFSPPRSLSVSALFAWLLVASLIARGGNSMFMVPYYAVGASLSSDYNERTSISGLRGLVGAIGTALAASLSFLVFFPDKVPGTDPKLNYSGYLWMGSIFGLVMTAAALISIVGTWPLRRQINSQHSPGKFFQNLSDSLRRPSFRIIVIAHALTAIGSAANSALQLHYLSYYVVVNASSAVGSAQTAFFAGGLSGMLLWLRVSSRFDKHKLYILSIGVTSALMLGAFLLVGEGRLFGTGDIRPLLGGYFLTGFFSCILWFLPQSMLADVADEVELTTGTRKEGSLFGLFSLSQQMATGVAILISGTLLDQFAGIVPGETRQSPSTVYRIGILYSAVPAALFAGAAILMAKYNLSRSQVEIIQTELRERQLEVRAATAGAGQ